MWIERGIFGKWEIRHIDLLREIGVDIDGPGPKLIGVKEDGLYFSIIDKLKDAEHFREARGYAHFSDSELQGAKSLLLHNFAPNMVFSASLRKEDDSYDYLRFAFGEICEACNHIPKGEQIKPFTLEKEPRLSSKNIWGSFHGVSGYVFTDMERFKILNSKWGLKKREVLIGAKQKVSTKFVQIDIPVSQHPLYFGNSDFGKTFKLDGSGEISDSVEKCAECGRPLYTNQILDYFPSFEREFEFDVVFTQEWFGWYRRLVVSKKFAEWLIDNKFVKWDSNFFIPVKDFKNQA